MTRTRTALLGLALLALSACTPAAASENRAAPAPTDSGHITVSMSWGPIQGPPGYGPAIPADSYRIVGGDFAPGIYRALVPSGSTCVYSVMVNDNGTVRPRLTDSASSGQVQVVLNGSDYGFQSRGCGPWRAV